MENPINVENIKNQWSRKCIFFKKTFLYYVLLYMTAMLALIRANFYYIDDFGRAAEGFREWEHFSRYISNLLSPVLHGGYYLTDVSPLTQVIAVLLLALSGTIVLSVFSEKKKITVWQVIAGLPLGLSPYFLECLSYKYDSPYMALSVLASVVPFVFVESRQAFYAFVSILGILTMCMTYQAASGIYPMIVVFLVFRNWNKHVPVRKNLQFAGVSALSYMFGIVAFKLFLMRPANSYVSNSVLPLEQLCSGCCHNLYKYYENIWHDFKKEWLVLIFLLFVGFVYISVRDSGQKKWLACIGAVFTLGAAGGLAFGLYPVLEGPLFAPRSMYGFGVLLALVAIQVMSTKKAYPVKVVSLGLSWCFFVFAFTYGNALAEQKRYTDFRVELVLEDLSELEIMEDGAGKRIQVSGSIGSSPIIRNMPQHYQILNRLVPGTFYGGGTWGEKYFFGYFGLEDWEGVEQIRIWNEGEPDLRTWDLPVLKDTMYHTIRGDEGYILIELKG